MKFSIPEYVQTVLDRFHNEGYEASIVGGCVRDFLMGNEPHDYDVCTSASPEEIQKCFSDFTTIDTGIRFGTVIILSSGRPVEATTYRKDGEYRDSRHPESVDFTPELREDLARRDFTMNAIAYSDETGFVDFFHGKEAIENRKIIAVGEPGKRFKEDALRMMRALRFASVLDFEIEDETDRAVRLQINDVKEISKERIQSELSRLLKGRNCDKVISSYGKELSSVIEGFCPKKINHLPEELGVRLSEVFPDNTAEYLKKLRYDRKTIKEAEAFSEIKKEKVPEGEKDFLRLLRKYGRTVTMLYAEYINMTGSLEKLLQQDPCFSVKQLAVDGKILMEEGWKPGPEIGRTLEYVLDRITEGQLLNQREEIMAFLKKGGSNE